MNLPLYWIDAFTDSVFHGNPAAVVPLETWLPTPLLQNIAREIGLSETAFFVKQGPARYHLRWFTPSVEMDLCGHATLASAFTLFSERGETASTIIFDSLSGPLTVRLLESGKIQLDFPSRPPLPAQPPEGLAAALGKEPQLILKNLNNWFCVFRNEEEVRSLQPDFAALSQVAPGRVIVTAPGQEPSCDFVSRFFAPGCGINEDPVTGSAHCALIPYWAERLGKTDLLARQISQRGGQLWCQIEKDRVHMAGVGRVFLKGSIQL